MLVKELIEMAARTHDYLDHDARNATVDFIKSKWNRDGGADGRYGGSDLCYTAFAAMGMRALKGRIPKLRLWNYLRSFGDGSSLEIEQLFSLIRLRSIFPMTAGTRDRLFASIEGMEANSATDMFFKVVMAEFLRQEDRPGTDLVVSESADTSDLAASVVVNHRPDPVAEQLLLGRQHETGGFCPTQALHAPQLGSTAKVVFALRVLEADLSRIRVPCLAFVESLRCANGGYLGHRADAEPDVENTFYALLSIGCLVGDGTGTTA